jgi:CheY-like chemotaxis protein/glycine cleavage system H lipoate-binding protein
MARRLNILVVDDEQIVLDSIKKLLKNDNYKVIGVLSAQDGIAAIDKGDIDIVLTDLMMPGIDGLEFMKIAKDKFPRLPIIMITGYATINTALQATQLGAFDYVAKPFSKAEFRSVVKRAADVVSSDSGSAAEADTAVKPHDSARSFKNIGDKSWMMMQDDGMVLMGVERSFLLAVGRLQNIFLPARGDKLRQGSVCMQLFSADMRSHTCVSPLSGTVVDINDKIAAQPELLIEDPYDEGWLIKLDPANYEYELKVLGL